MTAEALSEELRRLTAVMRSNADDGAPDAPPPGALAQRIATTFKLRAIDVDLCLYGRAQDKYFVSDALALRDNLDEFVGQRAMFRQQLPQWKQIAADWRAFFKQETGSDLIVKTSPEQ